MTTITKVTPGLLATIKRQVMTLGDVSKAFDKNSDTRALNHSELITATQVAISELTDALQDHLPEAVAVLRSARDNGDVAKLPPTLARAILEALGEE